MGKNQCIVHGMYSGRIKQEKKKSQEKPYYALACGISLNARFNTAVF